MGYRGSAAKPGLSPEANEMATRLALILAFLLLLVTAAQWYLRTVSSGEAQPVVAGEAAPASSEAWLDAVEVEESLEDIEEPALEIPEYIPPPVTERPRPPMGFPVDVLELELGAPQVMDASASPPAPLGSD